MTNLIPSEQDVINISQAQENKVLIQYFYEKNQVAEVKRKIQHRAEPHM